MNAAKKKRGVGRPKSEVTADHQMRVRMTADEYKEIARRADAAGMKHSEYLRRLGLGERI